MKLRNWFIAGVIIGGLISYYYIASFKREPVPESRAGIPVTLAIPTLGVRAAVEEVGQDSDGRMDVPKNIFDTGWYKYGARPGEVGNAVIDGHVNTPRLTPSVFANIDHLKTGDIISVTDNFKKTRTFKVYSVMNLPSQHFPVETVFGSFNSPNLVLITCSGVYQRYRRDYSTRTVVFSRLLN